ncbi:MAG: hypothetical protein ACJAU0_002318 [Flavobacteriales bacterium]
MITGHLNGFSDADYRLLITLTQEPTTPLYQTKNFNRSLIKTRTMKALLIPVFALFLFSCVSEQEPGVLAPLQTENDQLNATLNQARHSIAEKEAYLLALNGQMDELLPQLEQAQNPEVKIELTKKMQFIAERISSFENSIGRLQSALRTEERKAIEMTDDLLVAMDALADQEAEIELLVFELQYDGEQIAQLNDDLNDLEMRENIRAKKNAERLLAIGSQEELENAGVIERKGLPLFRRTELTISDAKEAKWRTIDLREICSIPMYSKEASVHSDHPTDSYSFTTDKAGLLTLVIENVDDFWNLSKCLVIEIG